MKDTGPEGAGAPRQEQDVADRRRGDSPPPPTGVRQTADKGQTTSSPPLTGARQTAGTERPSPPVIPDGRSPAGLTAELLLVAGLIVLPGIAVGSLVEPLLAGRGPVGRELVWLGSTVLLGWAPALVVWRLLRRGGEGLATVGLGRPTPGDLRAGLTLWVAGHLVIGLLGSLLLPLGREAVEFLPAGLPLWVLTTRIVVIAVTAGVTEELVVRGYAQTRLEQLRVPGPVVVALPTSLWALLHLYQGLGPTLALLGLGLVYASVFRRTGRLWPLVVAHTLFDLTVLGTMLGQT